MIETRVREEFEAGADRAALGVVSAVDQARDASLDYGAGAHAAGLDGDVESGVSKAVVAEKTGGPAKDDDFRVGGGVVVADCTVVRTRENLAVVDEHGPDGDFAGCGGCLSFLQRF